MLLRVIHKPRRESQHFSFLSIQAGDQQDIVFQRRIICDLYEGVFSTSSVGSNVVVVEDSTAAKYSEICSELTPGLGLG
jgi:hypothetical protein